MLLGSIDDGVIGPQTEPIVGGQGSNVVTQEKEDAEKGDEKSNGLHVLPVHGELDLEAMGKKAFYTMHQPTQGQHLCSSVPPPAIIPMTPAPSQFDIVSSRQSQGLCPCWAWFPQTPGVFPHVCAHRHVKLSRLSSAS